jgi:hypothetical protein
MDETQIRKEAVVRTLSEWYDVPKQEVEFEFINSGKVYASPVEPELSYHDMKILANGRDVETEDFTATVFFDGVNVSSGLLEFEVRYWDNDWD